jgi:hypothetical protein
MHNQALARAVSAGLFWLVRCNKPSWQNTRTVIVAALAAVMVGAYRIGGR